jgi:hypothetical protein
MAIRLNKPGFKYSQQLVFEGKLVFDERNAWSAHQPSAQKENEFILLNGLYKYGRWHLGVDDEQDENTKRHYKFPYGDFENVHRCGVLSAESRAGQYKHFDIEAAAAHLHGMIDEANIEGRKRSKEKDRQYKTRSAKIGSKPAASRSGRNRKSA